jgi:hypothetical protein
MTKTGALDEIFFTFSCFLLHLFLFIFTSHKTENYLNKIKKAASGEGSSRVAQRVQKGR